MDEWKVLYSYHCLPNILRIFIRNWKDFNSPKSLWSDAQSGFLKHRFDCLLECFSNKKWTHRDKSILWEKPKLKLHCGKYTWVYRVSFTYLSSYFWSPRLSTKHHEVANVKCLVFNWTMHFITIYFPKIMSIKAWGKAKTNKQKNNTVVSGPLNLSSCVMPYQMPVEMIRHHRSSETATTELIHYASLQLCAELWTFLSS